MRNIYKKLKYRVICSLLFIGITSVYLCAQKADIDLAQRFQTIEGFGASDCWTVQYVGKYWNETEKEKAVRRLFSQECDVDGSKVSDMKTLWALGQYSRFIRPGYTRIGLVGCEDLGGVFGSGYLSPDGDHLAIVFSNLSDEKVSIPVTLSNSDKAIDMAHSQMYVTDHEHNMQLKNEYLQVNNIILLPKSVSTVVYSLK